MFILSHLSNCNIAPKEEGETCGECNPRAANYPDCGKCKPGLECLKDENSPLLPYVPSRCRAVKGNYLSQFAF